MKMSEVRKYINAGLSDEQIAAIAKTEKNPAGGSGDNGGNGGNGGSGGNGNNGGNSEILAAIKALTETIQASNIAGAKNTEPETIDDILGNIIFYDDKEK